MRGQVCPAHWLVSSVSGHNRPLLDAGTGVTLAAVDTYGQRLAVAMEARGKMTVRELSDRIGVSEKTISRWRTSKHAPEGDNVRSAAVALGVSADYLLSLTADPTPPEDSPAARVAEATEILGAE
jgi:transcriptional regulator with XRE-family HTH domain